MLHLRRNFIYQATFKKNRYLSTSEISTALKPFYFAVHPDLFGQYPEQRTINENSLKQLSSIIESMQSKRSVKPMSLPFYLKGKERNGSFHYVKISIRSPNLRETVLTILKSCNLSTEYVDKIPIPPEPTYRSQTIKVNVDKMDFSKMSEDDPIFGQFVIKQKIREAQDSLKLRNWLHKNHHKAKILVDKSKPLTEEVRRLQENIRDKWDLLDIRWNCGWNETHYRGCLQSFMALAGQHPEAMHQLKGKVLVFAPFTGISLDGHIMLNSAEVRHNWLELIKNISTYDSVLSRIPNFEKAVSQVLRNIRIGRRKFMFKIMAGEYERNLLQITTSMSDYLSYRKFPKSWPDSLQNFELVVENEAGPLMVSPTGQFIIPSSLPGQLLVSFITTHMDEAKIKSNNYKQDKHKEKYLHSKCKDEFNLEFLRKDDNVTPELMIKCCERLLSNKHEINTFLKGMRLNICTYYSVLSDGIICIPWNFEL
ncbi:T-cell activation inhibitor, mitochondrial [Coccinella septempunctata]|uniref:T-cell activation inhibitor, mitochondrial n=1 Tax=Coccinella septempunctata TaxID=41139 RepID=UPI001D0890D1|nr:T-cell activation inhibitor, mitochondrial [Coccinella septempunctata]